MVSQAQERESWKTSFRVSFLAGLGGQSPFLVWGDVLMFLTFLGLGALVDEAARCERSRDTHPVPGARASLEHCQGDDRCAFSAGLASWMKSSFPLDSVRVSAWAFLSHFLTVHRSTWETEVLCACLSLCLYF